MSKFDSAAVDPWDCLPEDVDLELDGVWVWAQSELWVASVITSFARRAVRSIDPRDRHWSINSNWLYDHNALRDPLSRD